jgi:hypothetical protein
VRADLLAIPDLHQEVLQLLPGGQAYVEAAAGVLSERVSAATAASFSIEDRRKVLCYRQMCKVLTVLSNSLGDSPRSSQPPSSDAGVLSPAAMQLVLEVQLLTAGEVQRLQQQEQSSPGVKWLQHCTAQVLYSSNQLLQHQMRAVLQAGGSCLPPEVLQQAGLQLLQALAAPVQQLQAIAADSPAALRQRLMLRSDGASEQLYILRAAASGLELAADGCESSLCSSLAS